LQTGAWLLIGLPLLGAAVLLLGGRRTDAWGHWLGVAMSWAAFVWGALLFLNLHGLAPAQRARDLHLFSWVPAGSFKVDAGLLLDPLSVAFVLLVTFVGSLIHVYSVAYMEHDPNRRRFFAYLNLFVASMLLLVLADSYLLLYVGWEGVGLASYLLIGFWNHNPNYAAAAKKAFVANRVGDFGLSIAIMLMFSGFGAVSFAVVLPNAGKASEGLLTGIGLMLLLGACGKSAQFPLQSWLGDAMAGPTPVSALIHAATMVTAGVYLVVRSGPIFEHAPTAQLVVVIVGAITLTFGAVVGCAKDDIKKALAASTMSQIGYMMLAAGLGPVGYVFAIFHLLTHGFFKAGMFLGAGSVMHGMSDEQDMRRMGRLRKYMPITAATFIIGWLTIAGIFPLSGFWSKDEILAKAWFAHDYALWGIGVVAAVLTAFYMTRQVYLVFFGNARWDDHRPEADPVPVIAGASDDDAPGAAHDEQAGHGHGGGIHPHESPGLMTLPLVILAILSIFGGLLDLPFANQGWDFLTRWLEPVLTDGAPPTSFSLPLALATLASVGAVIGIVIGVAMYRRGLPESGEDPLPAKLGPFATLFGHAWFIDEGVAATVGGPGRKAFQWIATTVDQKIIDGAVVGVAGIFRGGSTGLKRMQTGLVRNYALAILVGAVALLLYILVRAG
jgi:NADH-quinone oxidoreductase subunit L